MTVSRTTLGVLASAALIGLAAPAAHAADAPTGEPGPRQKSLTELDTALPKAKVNEPVELDEVSGSTNELVDTVMGKLQQEQEAKTGASLLGGDLPGGTRALSGM